MTYVIYDDAVEARPSNEEAVIARALAATARIDRETYEAARHGLRQAHAKNQGVLKGELVVYDNPPPFAQGLFAAAKTYPLLLRFSTAPGRIHSDRAPSNVGMALKILGVEGEKADPRDQSANHDLLLVNSPVYLGTAKKYLDALPVIEGANKAPDWLLRSINAGARLVRAGLEAFGAEPPIMLRAASAPPNHILGETFHSMAALRYGGHIAKFRARPLSPEVRELTGMQADSSDTIQRDLVARFFAAQGAEYELCAQLCVDLKRMPVEDASTLWPDELSPPRPIARIVLPAQDAASAARLPFADDRLSFNPWRCLAAHRPLGSVMRLRQKVYAQSSGDRFTLNGAEPVEPTLLAQIPD